VRNADGVLGDALPTGVYWRHWKLSSSERRADRLEADLLLWAAEAVDAAIAAAGDF